MSLAIWVGDKRFEIGTSSFLKAWFSTIYIRLEKEDWGSVFPTIMREFYIGSLPYARAAQAAKELEVIKQQLTGFRPDEVVWDFEDRMARPPWGDQISPEITSLADYFVTSDGKDLLQVLSKALSESIKRKQDIVIT